MRRHHRGSLGGRREPAPSRTPRALLIARTLVATACRAAPAPGPQRVAVPATVVALAPSLVELLYELGLGDRLVGVGDYVKYPPEATEKLRLGGLFDPHLEEITRLAPDIAILLPSEERTRVHLDALGIEVLTVANESLEDIEATALTIARRFSVDERGAGCVAAGREALGPRRGRRARAERPFPAVARAGAPGSGSDPGSALRGPGPGHRGGPAGRLGGAGPGAGARDRLPRDHLGESRPAARAPPAETLRRYPLRPHGMRILTADRPSGRETPTRQDGP